MDSKDTIFALSTPAGKSAVALFRISGHSSHKLIKKISSNKKNKINSPLLNHLLNKEGKKIDQTITTYFKAPQSFTGENMVEVSCHGSIAVINSITKELYGLGMRLADKGEFTRRALYNDKMDLVNVEGLADLINAKTDKQREIAFKNLTGDLTNFLSEIENKIKKMLANIEAVIDFADEDLPKNIMKQIKEQNKNIIKEIEQVVKASQLSKSIISGFIVTIIGKPNTGKSCFLNFISGREVSIVTDIPGTTTDLIESSLEIGGFEIRFIDTAGIRNHRNKIEKIGIKKSLQSAKISDLNLVFLQNNEVHKYQNIKNALFVRSKIDIHKNIKKSKDISLISSKTGKGVEILLNKIKVKLAPKKVPEMPIISRERQLKKIEKCLKTLKKIKFEKNVDMLADDLRFALKEINEVYHKFDIEEILDIIFNDFCIGK